MADPVFRSAYDFLAPSPDANYGSVLPFAYNREGSGAWVQEGSNPRFALPEWLRSAAQGVVGLGESTQTGSLTPEALATLTMGSVGTGATLGARGALASGASRPPIRAYHGSPHDFDRFSFNKTAGTGEGGAAFGHGLYFAENEGVARSYRNLAGEPTPWGMQYGGQNIWTADPGAIPASIHQGAVELHTRLSPYKNPGDPAIISRTREGLEKTLANYTEADKAGVPYYREKFPGEYEKYRSETQAALAALDDPQFKVTPGIPSPGKMYEVNIHADPARFLDWDKPLSAQGAPVQKALEQFGYKADTAGISAFDDALLAALTDKGPATLPKQPPNPLGANIYESSKIVPGGYRDPVAASQSLREAGVPGLRYLDRVSRDAGTGTSNYVVFPTQDEIVEILRKYGFAVPSPAVPGFSVAPPPQQPASQPGFRVAKDMVF